MALEASWSISFALIIFIVFSFCGLVRRAFGSFGGYAVLLAVFISNLTSIRLNQPRATLLRHPRNAVGFIRDAHLYNAPLPVKKLKRQVPGKN